MPFRSFALLCVLLLFAACGGDAGSGADDTAAPAPAPADTTLTAPPAADTVSGQADEALRPDEAGPAARTAEPAEAPQGTLPGTFEGTAGYSARRFPGPVWPGRPMTAHWGVEDPAKVEGTPFERRAAFVRTFDQMKRRIGVFVALPIAGLDRLALGKRVTEIGKLEGATDQAKSGT